MYLPSTPTKIKSGHAFRASRADIPEELRDVPEAKDLFRVFSGEIPVADDATIRLMDGRRVRLLELIPRDGRVEVAFRQERTIR